MPSFEPIAIVGMAGIFPGARDLEHFWANIRQAKDAVRTPPPGRWLLEPAHILDPEVGKPDRIYSDKACFLDNVPAEPANLDPMHRLAVEIVRRSADACDIPGRSRAGVILGSIALPTDSISKWAVECVQGTPHTVDPLNRRVTGLPAEFAAKECGFGLGGFTLDAACASSLYAIKLACDRLQDRSADAMVAGGLSRPDSLYNQMGFAQLRALSAKGFCTPFDSRADGLIVGEGGGAFTLVRLSDAEHYGMNILGVIRGAGLSNDIAGGLLAPASEGQLRCMRMAYEQAGWNPWDVDLIECHATGTPVGDATEFASLCELWKDSPRGPGTCVIGSVKSNVGHLLTGANSAGLAKVLFAFRDGVLPPTANFQRPLEKIGYEASPFRVLSETREWKSNGPRRAAISGFGFGGINAHVLLEEYQPNLVSVDVPEIPKTPIAVIGLAATIGSVKDTRVIERELLGFEEKHGGTPTEFDFPLDRFRIPPTELKEALPQQLVLLECVDRALRDAGLAEKDVRIHDPRFGVYIAAGLDLNTTNFHLRWQAIANGQDPDAVHPPLTANRTMGALASIAASRIAKAYELGGPCFTVSDGMVALRLALDALRRGEIDHAVVAGIDLPCDFRETGDHLSYGEGAIAFVLGHDQARAWALVEDVWDFRPELHEAGHAFVGLKRCMESTLWVSMRMMPWGAGTGYWLQDREEGPRRAGPATEALHAEIVEAVTNRRPFEWLPSREPRLVQGPRPSGKVAFVYPGSGNQFPGMGLDFSVAFPLILDRQQAENRCLAGQYASGTVWNNLPATPRDLIFAQVSLGTLVSEILESCNVHPDAAIGYSLGESAAQFGLGIWRDRDGMYERIRRSTLFTEDLAPPYNAARKSWGMTDDEPLEWLTCLVPMPHATIQSAIGDRRVFVLIINTPTETVIGGVKADVESLLASINATGIPIEGTTLAHCPITQPVEQSYRELHTLPVHPRPNVTMYSTAWGDKYEQTSENAAGTITAGLLQTLDFPRVIEKAYADGVRIFLEIGPGNSCTRMIANILGDRPHLVMPLCVKGQDNVANLVRVLERLSEEGVPVKWPERKTEGPEALPTGKTMFLPMHWTPPAKPCGELSVLPSKQAVAHVPLASLFPFEGEANRLTEMAKAHNAFLRISTATQESMAGLIADMTRLMGETPVTFATLEERYSPLPQSEEPPRSLDFADCTEFAVGSIGKVLGPKYAVIDSHPTRVRLPEGPLMLVDRILEIEGDPLSLTHGRVVTEHDVYEGRWYLDAGRIPTCVAVEAGQADLFLSGFLGIDLKTKGLACYRLLDAVVTFHGPLPAVGTTIHYDIHIDSFFRQGETYLFRFHFLGTVNGQRLITMTEGIAGFFTAADLAAGKGIVHTALELRPMPGKKPDQTWRFVPLNDGGMSFAQLEGLRRGDLVAAFGPSFAKANVRKPATLPGGMLKLVDRVTSIEPEGGRFGLGRIRAEMDIHPDDWFLTCHFVDDQVMPGTLMYECCMHTLRVLLMRVGWIGEEGEAVCEPVPGIASRLKCRGQVIHTTKVVTYEVTLKEVGYRPEPFVICDALMYADGKPIVEISNMSLRMSGLTYEKLAAIWGGKRVLFDTDRITAFAIGNPSDAFGEPYKVFDSDRVIARLPGPPYQFLDRITSIENCEPFVLKAGGVIEAEYDVPPGEWYFGENRCNLMPFSILLEIALQPCGWLAGYLGSALTSNQDLSFRNLGGSAVQHREVTPGVGTLTTRVKITKVSQSVGMIIQHFEYEMLSPAGPVYSGDTYFGFFAKEALRNQVGMPAAKWHVAETPPEWTGVVPHESPFPGDMLRMVDKVDHFSVSGGPHGLGFVQGSIAVDPSFWFFKAHFHQDPVWPGSLGLEAFLQLLKLYAHKLWGTPSGGWQAMAVGEKHGWTYRGQVLPTDATVTVQVAPNRINDFNRKIWADGYLMVDGRIIYHMEGFSLAALESGVE